MYTALCILIWFCIIWTVVTVPVSLFIAILAAMSYVKSKTDKQNTDDRQLLNEDREHV